MWLKDARCEGVVKNAWERQALGNPMEKLAWSKLSFGNIQRLLQQKKKLLPQVEALSMSFINHDQV